MVSTIDDIIDKKYSGSEQGLKIFLKLDTQGNELNILKGALHTLPLINAVLLEHIFATPYKSKYDFNDLIGFMYETGFICNGALSIEYATTGEVSVVDFLFTK